MEDVSGVKMPRHQRYYLLHREEKINKVKERYNNNPEVIAKREERERKKAEKEAEKEAKKEAEKEAKRQEKERQREEKIALALATSKKRKIEFADLETPV
jgi:hypothetical protein